MVVSLNIIREKIGREHNPIGHKNSTSGHLKA